MHQREKEWRDSKAFKKSLKSSKVSEISPGDQNSKEESTHHKNKERQWRMHHISKRNCRCFWRILQKTLRGQRERWFQTWNEWWQKNTWNYDRRVTKRNQQTQKRQNPRQRNSCPRHHSLPRRDERHGETTLQRDHKEKQFHTSRIEESDEKSDSQERRRGKCEQLPPDLLIAPRCANCSRQVCNEEYTQCFTINKL